MTDPHLLPPPTRLATILRHVGPGLIISANIVGSGELIVTPKLGATHGIDLLWFIVIGCLLKVFVQIELARYAVARGGTTLEAMNRIPGPRCVVSWLVWLWVLMFAATFFQVAGMAGGIAQVLLLAGVPVDQRLLAVGIGVTTAVLLLVGRYRTIEVLSTVMVGAFTVATLAAVGALQFTPFALTGADLMQGFSLNLPSSFTVAFAAFGVIGVGAAELIYYPYWCLEKGYARHVGPPDGTSAWAARARGWLRVLRIDAWLSCAVYTTATVAFFLLGATILHTRQLTLVDSEMIPTLFQMYSETFGAWSLPFFLAGAFFVLFSTVFVSTASNTRLIADACGMFGLIRSDDRAARDRVIRWSCVLLPVAWTGIYLVWGQPLSLVLVGAIAQGLMLPFLGIVALWLHHRQTDEAVRPTLAWRVALWLSALSMAAVGLFQVWGKLLETWTKLTATS